MQKITPCLWFNLNAEEAVKFYGSIFKKFKVRKIAPYSEAAAKASGQPKGSVMTIEFEMEGQRFLALNGGPHFQFTEAISLIVECKTQAELDKFWNKLSAGGEPSQCGWLKDKFGLSWQIIPSFLLDAIGGKDAKKSARVMEAVLQMRKLEVKKLKEAEAKPSARL